MQKLKKENYRWRIKKEQIFSTYFASLITEEDKVELSSAENI